jgi:hypothetical protein
MAARQKWPCRCLATGGMDSRLAGLGAAQWWRRSGRFVASACATMLIVAAGLVFRKRKRQTGALVPDANRYGVWLPLHPLQPLRRTRWTESQA